MTSSMPQPPPWQVNVTHHPGSSQQEIRDEPNWIKLQTHSIGFKNRQGRRPGLVVDREEEIEAARRQREELDQKVYTGDLVNFRDLIHHQPDFHLRHPENRSLGWRYVLETTEDWVKNQQKWPINLRKWEKEKEEEKKKKEEQEKETGGDTSKRKQQNQESGNEEEEKPELTAQERALLEAIEGDSHQIANLKENDGKKKSPQTHNRSSITIDEQDQFTPDNWLPRCPDLTRLTGKHPMNAEPPLTRLFEGGLITPNELHFVRNHGSVPCLVWEFHNLDISYNNKTLSLTMDELKTQYASSTINIPIALACTGNRRKELNLHLKTKGANNAAASVSCAYWKGPLLRAVLLSAGVPATLPPGKRLWVNFAGADHPSAGTYETCIPLSYAMDPCNDVLLAMEMNDLPLPPDHGYPVRLMIPGWVGGRCIKWLRSIWITDHENDSYYHVWDNRVVPPFVRSKESDVGKAMFNHPSTICNEQVLNSVVCRPAQGRGCRWGTSKRERHTKFRGMLIMGRGMRCSRSRCRLMGERRGCLRRESFQSTPSGMGTNFGCGCFGRWMSSWHSWCGRRVSL